MMMTHPVAGTVVRWDGPESLAEVQTLPGASGAVMGGLGGSAVCVGAQSSFVAPGMYVCGQPVDWNEARTLVSFTPDMWREWFGTMPEAT